MDGKISGSQRNGCSCTFVEAIFNWVGFVFHK